MNSKQSETLTTYLNDIMDLINSNVAVIDTKKYHAILYELGRAWLKIDYLLR